ncbi:hypothetical protein VP01_568g3 [Puccinia sorghi]|uniref:Uncharacterized protein n=1 Tax=Puccinia sorghi TaxID=27349 RepID=A0A0L6UIQ4_9BASI|nr:hypothetical protein VP01_568g3 [Puccinia sorghi]
MLAAVKETLADSIGRVAPIHSGEQIPPPRLLITSLASITSGRDRGSAENNSADGFLALLLSKKVENNSPLLFSGLPFSRAQFLLPYKLHTTKLSACQLVLYSMSDSNHNCHDELAHLDNLIDSNFDPDGPYSYVSHDMNPQDDSWQYESLPGSQTESQPCAEAHGSLPYTHAARLPDCQEYDQLARQSLSHSPSAPSFWPDVQPEEYSSFGRDGHDVEYREFPPVFPVGAREFGWTDSGWSSEQQFYTSTGEQHTGPYPPDTQFFHDHSIAPADPSCPPGFHNSEESNAAKLSQREMSIEDEGFPAYAFLGSSSQASNFDHMYEPAPSNATRSSLLSEWIDISPRGLQTLPDVRLPAASQHLSAESLEGPNSRVIEAAGSHESSLGLYASACNTSPVDTGSLPDLSSSRHQTPGSGPMDVAGMERPRTPYRSVVKYGGQTEREYSDYLPAGTPGSFGHRFSVGGNSTLPSFTKPFSSRSSSYTTFTGSHSHFPEDGRLLSLDSRRPLCTSFPAISIPSPPQLFANTPISRSNSCANPSALKFPALLPPITDAHLQQPRPKETENSVEEPQSGKESKKNSSRSKTDRPKRKRMHIHQRQLHVLESQMPLPEIPGPTSELDAYNFGSQTRF